MLHSKVFQIAALQFPFFNMIFFIKKRKKKRKEKCPLISLASQLQCTMNFGSAIVLHYELME